MQKNVKYLKIQESSQSENSIEYYYLQRNTLQHFFSTPKHISQA